MKRFTILVAALAAWPVAAQDTTKVIWGGGDPQSSAYSGKYVPYVRDRILGGVRLAGYEWGGPTNGTTDNIARVERAPTNLALGQLDLLRQAIEDGHKITILQEDLGPECLYLVTKDANYETLGHVMANAWDISIATGGGSRATWDVLTGLYPELADAAIVETSGAANIVDAVAVTGEATFGFFVQRPDPSNAVFKRIGDAGLTFVPVIDFALEEHYDVESEYKVKQGGFFSDAEYVGTACTSVALFTGDPASIAAGDNSNKRRLDETIARVRALNSDELKQGATEMFVSWQDYLDTVRTAAADKLNQLKEKSKAALDKAQQG